ncbi:hypothetical protein R1sor_009947 [Riccia sorocarpa]|uniref:Uncharacterized protein n=1 Tax=Riccia sorocarpa TaxID=122646 RepID=A0ABD3HYA1_9MARC
MAGVTKDGDGKFAHERGHYARNCPANTKHTSSTTEKGKLDNSTVDYFIPVGSRKGREGSQKPQGDQAGTSSNPYDVLATEEAEEGEINPLAEGTETKETDQGNKKDTSIGMETEQGADSTGRGLDLNLSPAAGTQKTADVEMSEQEKKEKHKSKKKEARQRKKRQEEAIRLSQGRDVTNPTDLVENEGDDTQDSDSDDESTPGFWKKKKDPLPPPKDSAGRTSSATCIP